MCIEKKDQNMMSDRRGDSVYENEAEANRLAENIGGPVSGDGKVIFERLDPDARTLEVGCSAGAISLALERDMGFSNVVATDVLPALIYAGRRLAASRGSRVHFQVADVRVLPFREGSFKQVIALGVLVSHLVKRSDRQQALTELCRVLAPGGKLVIGVRNYEQGGYMPIVKSIVRLTRLLYNPLNHDKYTLPRLGSGGGRPDLLFFRPSKQQLYCYRPGLFVHDLINAGFSIEFFRSSIGAGFGLDLFSRWKPRMGSDGDYVQGGYGLVAIGQKRSMD